jgi:hypothetical protein
VLRLSKAQIGCEAEIAGGLAVVLRHALAVGAANPVVEGGNSVTLVGCEAEITSGLAKVSGMGYRGLLRGRRWPAPGTLKLTATRTMYWY